MLILFVCLFVMQLLAYIGRKANMCKNFVGILFALCVHAWHVCVCVCVCVCVRVCACLTRVCVLWSQH